MGEHTDRASARRLLKDGALLFAVVTAANVSNYLFHLVMTRLLGPADYGALGALLAVVLVLSVPTGALQAVVARRAAAVASDENAVGVLVRGSLRLTTTVGIAFAVVIAAAVPWGRDFLRISSVVPLLFIAAFIVPTTVSPVASGALQGTQRFRWLGATLAIGAAVKLALGVAFVELGFGVSGAVAAVAVGAGAMLVVALWPIRRLLLGSTRSFAATPLARETARAGLAFLAYWLSVSVDLLLVRHYHPGAVSGRYAAAALLGRAVLFLPAAIALVVYPRFAEGPARAESRRLLLVSMVIVGATGGAVSVVVLAFPRLIATMFGSEYVGSGSVGPTLTLAMTAFGLVWLLLHYGLAAARPPVKILWVATAVQTGAIVAVSSSPRAVAAVVLTTGASLAGWLMLRVLRVTRVEDVATGEPLQPKPALVVDLSQVAPSSEGAGPITSIPASPQKVLAETGDSTPAEIRTIEMPDVGDGATGVIRAPFVSVVLPCLDEAGGVGLCVSEAQDALRKAGIPGEVIVVDNGSSDGSSVIAAAAGARVVVEPQRGYGRALRTGIEAASGNVVVMADADGTYDLTRLSELIEPVISNRADLVIAERMNGGRASMPLLHRHIGTPILTALIRRASGGTEISDSQSGFRAFRRQSILGLGLRADGMEFASEMLIKACNAKLRFIECSVPYRDRVGDSKLNTFSDGWRHLRLILFLAPHLMLMIPGVMLAVAGLVLSILSLVVPSGIELGSFRWQPTFFSSIALVLGVQATLAGMLMARHSSLVGEAVQKRFAFVSTPSFVRRLQIAGILAITLGFLTDLGLFLVWASKRSLASGLGVAALAQTSLLIGGTLMIATLMSRLGLSATPGGESNVALPSTRLQEAIILPQISPVGGSASSEVAVVNGGNARGDDDQGDHERLKRDW